MEHTRTHSMHPVLERLRSLSATGSLCSSARKTLLSAKEGNKDVQIADGSLMGPPYVSFLQVGYVDATP